MENKIITQSHLFPDKKLLVSRLSGEVKLHDIELWEQSLHLALGQIEDGGIFKILVNLWGFKAASLEAHKRYREIIPLTLANYGWKVGYVDLFEESASMEITNIRGIQCVGAAHVHQDETKIDKYEALFGRVNEHFFTDPQHAEEWILKLPLPDLSLK